MMQSTKTSQSIYYLFMLLLVLLNAHYAVATDSTPSTDIKTLSWSDLNNTPYPNQTDHPLPNSKEPVSDLPPMPDLGQITPQNPQWLIAGVHPLKGVHPSQSTPQSKSLYDGQQIEISGYIVPIEYSVTSPSLSQQARQHDTQHKTAQANPNRLPKRLLSMHRLGAILFEQASPQTQTIYVDLTTAYQVNDFTQPYWITGYLFEQSETHLGATARYTLRATDLKAYNPKQTGRQ